MSESQQPTQQPKTIEERVTTIEADVAKIEKEHQQLMEAINNFNNANGTPGVGNANGTPTSVGGRKQRKQKKQRGGDAWQHTEAVYGGISQQQAAPGSNVIASRSVSGGGGAPAPFAHSELGSNTNQPHPLSPPTQTGGRRKSRKNRSKRQQKTRQQRRQ